MKIKCFLLQITAIILCFYLRTVVTESDLQQQNAAQDQLNPLNDFEDADTTAKAQDKRTVFNTANYGWAKHVGIKPSGHKYVIGYSPVDLKYSPVIRPLSVKHPGYVYGRPSINFHVKRPAVLRPVRPVNPVVWKPSVAVKPVVSVHVPPSPPHHHHVGVAHVDHVHVKPVHHVDHVAHVDHVHHQVHTDHIHQVQVPHAGHVHNVPVHVDHVHPAPVHPVHVHPIHVQPVAVAQPVPAPLPQPLLPASLPQPFLPAPLPQHLVPVVPQPQFIPSPLFEVTKPDLGVLPLGAAFPSPILRDIPHLHQVHLPLKPALVPQPIVPAAVPLPQAVPVPRPAVIPQHLIPQHVIPQPLPQPVVPQQIVPQPAYPPGTVVEYHGITNFANRIPINAPHPHFHLLPQAPQHVPVQPAPALPHEQHDVQTPIIPGRPHFIQQPIDLPQFQQQLPLDTPSHFQPADHINTNLFQQQLPVNTQQTQFQDDQNPQQFVPQDSGPGYQPADQVSTQQFFHGSINTQQGNFEQLDNQEGGYIYQQPDVPFGQHSIQPGTTDLQLPLQLPQHPGFVQNSRQLQQNNAEESSQFHDVFRPSIQLEPPYKK